MNRIAPLPTDASLSDMQGKDSLSTLGVQLQHLPSPVGGEAFVDEQQTRRRLSNSIDANVDAPKKALSTSIDVNVDAGLQEEEDDTEKDPLDEWIAYISKDRQKRFSKESGLSKRAFGAAFRGATDATKDAKFSDVPKKDRTKGKRGKVARRILEPFLESIWQVEDASKWERVKYYWKGLIASFGQDEYKKSQIAFRGELGKIKSMTATMRAKLLEKAPDDQISLATTELQYVVLYLLATLAANEDLLRMSGAPMKVFTERVSGQLAEIAVEWPVKRTLTCTMPRTTCTVLNID